MCDKCFNKEFQRFESELQFLELDKRLSFKLGNSNTLISKELGANYHNINFDSYFCTNCKEEWCLSIPDHGWRGFFLTKTNCNNQINSIRKADKIKSIFGILFLILLILTIIFTLT